MSDPWLTKNPFMSIWLSTTNRMAGSIRTQATAQVNRQVKAAATEATNESIKLWLAAVTGPVLRSGPASDDIVDLRTAGLGV